MNSGPIIVEFLFPPPIVAQIGDTIDGGSVAISQLFKTLLDVDTPGGGWGIGQDGWVPVFNGTTQHLALADIGSLLANQSLGEHTNVLPAVDTAANDDFLVYNGTNWRNMTLAAVQALMGAGFTVAGTATTGYVVTSVGGTPTWQANPGLVVSGSATNGYVVTSVGGTPTWQAAGAGFTVSGTATNGYVVTSVGGTPTWASPTAASGGPVALRSNIAGQASYDTIGGVSFFQAIFGTGGGTNYTYFKIPAGYTKARVTVAKTEAGALYVIRITPSSGVPPTDLPVASTYSTFYGSVTGVTTPVFSVSSGDYVFWGYTGESGTYGAGHTVDSMQLELFP